MRYTVEMQRAKDGAWKSATSKTDGTESDFKKMVNSYDLFYRVGLFKALRITDENGTVAYKRGNI